MAAKRQTKSKSKRKAWYPVHAPALFGEKEVGETYLFAPENGLGRCMRVNMRNLTGSMRDQSVYITLAVNKLEGNQLHTLIKEYTLDSGYVKRMVRKNSSRVDVVHSFKTKDDKEILVKGLILTYGKSPRSTGVQLRNKLVEELTTLISAAEFNELVNNVIGKKIQSDLKKVLNSVFPVKDVVLRHVELQNVESYIA